MKKIVFLLWMTLCSVVGFCADGVVNDEFSLDLRTGAKSVVGMVSIRYNNSLWGGDGSTMANVAVNGEVIASGLTGDGFVSWSAPAPGAYTFTHTIYKDGVAVETISAPVYFDGDVVPNEPMRLDLRTGIRETKGSEVLQYSGLWSGDESSEIEISSNGKILHRSITGEGKVDWDVTEPGLYTLTHTTHIALPNGTNMVDVLRARFYLKGQAAQNEMFFLDLNDGVRASDGHDEFVYSSLWNGNSSDAVRVDVDGKVLVEATRGEGVVEWKETAPGLHTATHTISSGSGTNMTHRAQFLIVDPSQTVLHGGILTSNEVWKADKVHVVWRDVTVPETWTITFEPGAIVKFMPGTGIYVEGSSRAVYADGVIFTHIDDDTVGGDTLYDGETAIPEMNAYALDGNWNISDACEMRYFVQPPLKGTISKSQTLRPGGVYEVTDNLVIASGATLTIPAGTILKFAAGKQFTVNSGGTLNANGTRAAPIVFTSIKDDEHGGDTNGDGDKTAPVGGDWYGLWVYGEANLNYVKAMYAGPSNERGIVQTSNSGKLVMNECTIAHAKYDGVWNWGGSIVATNCVITDVGNGACPYRGTKNEYVNCVFYGLNYYAMYWSSWQGGDVSFKNCVMSGIGSNWMDTNGATLAPSRMKVSNCLFFNEEGVGPQSFSERVGKNGNIWGDPKFIDPDNGDFRTQAGSACVDAADGTVAPETDYYGQTRQDIRTVADAGTPSANGACPDIGIYETMPREVKSDIDLEIVSFSISTNRVIVGDEVAVSWTVKNIGSEDVDDSWRDTFELIDSNGVVTELGMADSNGGLPSGGIRNFKSSFVVPPIIKGDAQIHVYVNKSRDVFEGTQTENNVLVADESIEVENSELVISDEPQTLTVSGNGQVYAIAEATSRMILFTSEADINIYATTNGVAAAYNFMWTAEHVGNGLSVLVIPDDVDLSLLNLSIVPSDNKSVGVEIEAIDPSDLWIETISRSSVSASSEEGMFIYGYGFTDGMSVSLDLGDGEIVPGRVEVKSPASAYVVFDTSKALSGACSLVVEKGDVSKRVDNAISVVQSKVGPKISVAMDVPSATRQGRWSFVTVRVSNTGDMSADAPILVLKAKDVTFRSPDDAKTEYEEMIHLMFLSGSGDCTKLLPSETVKVVVPFRCDGSSTISFKYQLLNEPGKVVGYAGIVGFESGDGTEASEKLSKLQNAYPTSSAFLKACLKKAEMACGNGFVPACAEPFYMWVIDEVDDNHRGIIYGQVLDWDTKRPISNLSMDVYCDDGTNSIVRSVRTDENGWYVAYSLPYGEPFFSCDGEASVTMASVERFVLNASLCAAPVLYYSSTPAEEEAEDVPVDNMLNIQQYTAVDGTPVVLWLNNGRLTGKGIVDGATVSQIEDDIEHPFMEFKLVPSIENRDDFVLFASTHQFVTNALFVCKGYWDGANVVFEKPIEVESSVGVKNIDVAQNDDGTYQLYYLCKDDVSKADSYAAYTRNVTIVWPVSTQYAKNRMMQTRMPNTLGANLNVSIPFLFSFSLSGTRHEDALHEIACCKWAREANENYSTALGIGKLAGVEGRGSVSVEEKDVFRCKKSMGMLGGCEEKSILESMALTSGTIQLAFVGDLLNFMRTKAKIDNGSKTTSSTESYKNLRNQWVHASLTASVAVGVKYERKYTLAVTKEEVKSDDCHRAAVVVNGDVTGSISWGKAEQQGGKAIKGHKGVTKRQNGWGVSCFDASGTITGEVGVDWGSNRSPHLYGALSAEARAVNVSISGRAEATRDGLPWEWSITWAGEDLKGESGEFEIGSKSRMRMVRNRPYFEFKQPLEWVSPISKARTSRSVSSAAAADCLMPSDSIYDGKICLHSSRGAMVDTGSTMGYCLVKETCYNGDIYQALFYREKTDAGYSDLIELGNPGDMCYTPKAVKLNDNGDLLVVYLTATPDYSQGPEELFDSYLKTKLMFVTRIDGVWSKPVAVDAMSASCENINLCHDPSIPGARLVWSSYVEDGDEIACSLKSAVFADNAWSVTVDVCNERLPFIDVNLAVNGTESSLVWTECSDNEKNTAYRAVLRDGAWAIANFDYSKPVAEEAQLMRSTSMSSSGMSASESSNGGLMLLAARSSPSDGCSSSCACHDDKPKPKPQPGCENCGSKDHLRCGNNGGSSSVPQSCDPNEMAGPLGEGEQRFVKVGTWMDYTIYFENKSDAEAAACEVFVNAQLSECLDWSTFEMKAVGFGEQIDMGLDGKSSGGSEVKMNGTNFIVRTELTFDKTTGKVKWYLRIKDPTTIDNWPEDAYAGFLPPNDPDTHCGEGYISYRIKVRDDAPAGARIDASADIVFDHNEVIETDPAWWNTVGATDLSFAFDKKEYKVKENATSLKVNVKRTGKSKDAVSVRYATVAGTAKPGEDYEPITGTLSWAEGDTKAKTLVIPLIPDLKETWEGVDKQFTIQLVGLGVESPVILQESAKMDVGTIQFAGEGDGTPFANPKKPAITVKGGESGTLLITREGAADGEVGVKVTMKAGSKTVAGTDFTPPEEATFIWEDGENDSRAFTFGTAWTDATSIVDKTLTISLAALPKGTKQKPGPEYAAKLGAAKSVTVTIRNPKVVQTLEERIAADKAAMRAVTLAGTKGAWYFDKDGNLCSVTLAANKKADLSLAVTGPGCLTFNGTEYYIGAKKETVKLSFPGGGTVIAPALKGQLYTWEPLGTAVAITPVDKSVVAQGFTIAGLKYTDAENADGYEIHITENKSKLGKDPNVTGLLPGKTYYWRVDSMMLTNGVAALVAVNKTVNSFTVAAAGAPVTEVTGQDAEGTDIAGNEIVVLYQGVKAELELGTATPAEGQVTYSVVGGKLPGGLRISRATRDSGGLGTGSGTRNSGGLGTSRASTGEVTLITGVPTTPGTNTVVVQAKAGKVGGVTRALTFVVKPMELALGTFAGVAEMDREVEAYLNSTNKNESLASVSLTIAKTGTLSAKVMAAGKTFSFKGTGFDAYHAAHGDVDGLPAFSADLFATTKIGTETVTNTLGVVVPYGTTNEANVVITPAFADLTLVFQDGKLPSAHTNVYTGDLYRDNRKEASVLPALASWEGYYTVSLPVDANAVSAVDGTPQGAGYVTMTIDKKGSAKFVGVLGDGTSASLSAVPALDAVGNLILPLHSAKGQMAFGGELVLTREMRSDYSVEDAAVEMGVLDEGKTILHWHNADPKATYGLATGGFSLPLDATGGFYDKLVNFRRFYLDAALSVKADLEDYDSAWQPSKTSAGILADPNGEGVWFEGGKMVVDKQALVKDPANKSLYDLAASTNASGVSVSFTQATGLFKGKFNLWFENEVDTKAQVKQAIDYAGVLTPVKAVDSPFAAKPGLGHWKLQVPRDATIDPKKSKWTGSWLFEIGARDVGEANAEKWAGEGVFGN